MTDQAICEIIERETGHPVTMDTPIQDLNVDSLEFIDLIMVLGEVAESDIPPKQMAMLKTVGDIQKALA